MNTYSIYEYFICPSPCKNVTFTTLDCSARSEETLTCSCCGRQVKFTKTNLPEAVSEPLPENEWGERTDITSLVVKYSTDNWQHELSDVAKIAMSQKTGV